MKVFRGVLSPLFLILCLTAEAAVAGEFACKDAQGLPFSFSEVFSAKTMALGNQTLLCTSSDAKKRLEKSKTASSELRLSAWISAQGGWVAEEIEEQLLATTDSFSKCQIDVSIEVLVTTNFAKEDGSFGAEDILFRSSRAKDAVLKMSETVKRVDPSHQPFLIFAKALGSSALSGIAFDHAYLSLLRSPEKLGEIEGLDALESTAWVSKVGAVSSARVRNIPIDPYLSAHEVGHVLGLSHYEKGPRLSAHIMATGSVTPKSRRFFDATECEAVRSSALILRR